MDNLQYKDETQNMAKVSLQKGITIHQPSWLSSRIWKIRNYRALQHNCRLFKQKRRYKINLKKKNALWNLCSVFTTYVFAFGINSIDRASYGKKMFDSFPEKKKGTSVFTAKQFSEIW